MQVDIKGTRLFEVYLGFVSAGERERICSSPSIFTQEFVKFQVMLLEERAKYGNKQWVGSME